MIAIVLCLALLEIAPVRDRGESLAVCRAVAEEAERNHEPPALAIALSWHESALRWRAVSRAGAVGPLQVMPRYVSCDFSRACLVRSGVQMIAYWRGRFPEEASAIAHYNGGNRPPDRSFRWARAVVRLANKIRGKSEH